MGMSDMHMGHGMGGMSMGDGVPSPFYLQKMYWAVIGAAIGCATVINVYNKVLYRQRMSAAGRKDELPAKPRAFLPSTMATVYAIARELTYASCPLVVANRLCWTSPTLGRVSMVAAELVLVLVLCFYKLNPQDQWQWEDIGYRIGYIASAQLPLIVLLSGKRNIIGWFTGTSYERLNWLHRWVSRVLFLTVTIHMGFWFVDWARYDYIKVKLTTDRITQRGFAAWCILLWIVFSSLLPVRRWSYEFFVVQHIVTSVGFLAAVCLHLPEELKVWVWLPVGFYVFDRLLRALATLFINVPILNRRTRGSGMIPSRAKFQHLCGGMTRITIEDPPLTWNAGQHVFLTCHALAPLQAHPFTIASIPEDGKLEFLVKSKSGGTKRFFRHAEKSQSLPVASGDLSQRHARGVILEGPYGRIRPLRQFDSVFLVAGGSGATFTVPLMRDIVSCWLKKAYRSIDSCNHPAFVFQGAATRYVRFIWAIKSQEQYDWFRSKLETVVEDVRQLKSEGWSIEVEMSIYITCDQISGGETVKTERQQPLGLSHGTVEEVSAAQNSKSYYEKEGQEIIQIDSISSSSQNQSDTARGCGPHGTCCCRRAIEDEGAALSSKEQCRCSCDIDKIEPVLETSSSSQSTHQRTDASSQTSVEQQDVKISSYPEIAMLSGRPQPRNLIRKTLEQALGESAVVVCGPQSLVDEVRQSVVALSDERAVHKGTGAQGIYFHAESFEY
ncbi:MAG: hypothetical protein Q9225_001531 [Loekoesia sp. 1 TL-2023]